MGVSNWAASTDVSNRGYECVFVSPNASRCLLTSNPHCFRSRLLDLASAMASSSVSAAPPLVCVFANGIRHRAATNKHLTADRRASITDYGSPHSAALAQD